MAARPMMEGATTAVRLPAPVTKVVALTISSSRCLICPPRRHRRRRHHQRVLRLQAAVVSLRRVAVSKTRNRCRR